MSTTNTSRRFHDIIIKWISRRTTQNAYIIPNLLWFLFYCRDSISPLSASQISSRYWLRQDAQISFSMPTSPPGLLKQCNANCQLCLMTLIFLDITAGIGNRRAYIAFWLAFIDCSSLSPQQLILDTQRRCFFGRKISLSRPSHKFHKSTIKCKISYAGQLIRRLLYVWWFREAIGVAASRHDKPRA